MKLKPAYWDEATSALARRDRVLKKLIRAHPGVHLRSRGDPFTSLSRAIVGQQIAVKAADTIWRRFVATVAPHPHAKIARKLDPRAVAALELAAPASGATISPTSAFFFKTVPSKGAIIRVFSTATSASRTAYLAASMVKTTRL